MKAFLIFYTTACNRILILLLSLNLILSTGCSNPRIERTTSTPDEMIYERSSAELPYLKLHMKNGELYVLSDWMINKDANEVTGSGSHQNLNREILDLGDFQDSLYRILF